MQNDYVIVFIRKTLLIVIAIGTASVLARYLGVELRGEYAYITNFAMILVVALNLGVNVNYQNSRYKFGKEIIPFYLIYSFLSFLIILFFGVIYYFINGSSTLFYILIISAASLLRLQVAHYNLIENLKKSATIAICLSLFELIALLLCYLLFNESLKIVILIFFFKELIVGILSVFFVYKKWFENHSKQQSITTGLTKQKTIQIILPSGFYPYFITVLTVINYKIDTVMLKSLSISSEAIGIFSIGVFFAEYIWVISDIFKDVQTKRSVHGAGADALSGALRMASFFTICAMIIFIICGPFIIQLLVGSSYSESYYVSLALLPAVYLMIFAKLIGNLYMTQGKTKVFFYTMLISSSINIMMNYFLIPIFGVYGAVISSFISYGLAGSILLINFCSSNSISLLRVIFPLKSDISALTNFLTKNSYDS